MKPEAPRAVTVALALLVVSSAPRQGPALRTGQNASCSAKGAVAAGKTKEGTREMALELRHWFP